MSDLTSSLYVTFISCYCCTAYGCYQPCFSFISLPSQNHDLIPKKYLYVFEGKIVYVFLAYNLGILSKTRPCLQIVYNFFDCELKRKYIPHEYF